MARPRIVHFLPNLNTGGAQVFTVNLLRTINKHQYDCTLVTLSTPAHDNHLLHGLMRSSIEHYALGKDLGFSIRTIFHLRKLLQHLKPDILHTHMHTLKYVYFAYLGAQPPPWIHTIHTLANMELLYLERKIASHLFRTNTVQPIAVSQTVAESLKRTYHISKVQVIYNRIPCQRMPKGKKSQYRRVLSLPLRGTIIINVARLAPAKNHSMLLRAFSRVLKKQPNVYLLLIGDGPLRAVLEAETYELGIHRNVMFLGTINAPELFMKASDIFALSSEREGLPVSLLEAMRAGLPVIATKAGGISEIVEDSVNGYLVDIGDVEGFAHALAQLVKSKNRSILGLRGKKKICTAFNIEITARAYEEVYTQRLHAS